MPNNADAKTGGSLRRRVPRAEERISFDAPTARLTVRLRSLALALRHEDRELATGSTLDGSALVVGGRLSVAGTVRGHLVAVDSDVVLAAGGRVEGYLYLVDSRLDAGDGWDPSQRFHSILLAQPWREIEAVAEDRTAEAAATARGQVRTWRFAARGQAAGSDAVLAIDTRGGKTEVRGGDGGTPRRFLVDEVDRSDWFAPFAGSALTFSSGPVLAFGGEGARLDAGSGEWTIPSGNVVAVTADGYAVLGARGGVRYQVRRGRLVGRDALMRCHFPDDGASYEGRELIFDLAERRVEVRP